MWGIDVSDKCIHCERIPPSGQLIHPSIHIFTLLKIFKFFSLHKVQLNNSVNDYSHHVIHYSLRPDLFYSYITENLYPFANLCLFLPSTNPWQALIYCKLEFDFLWDFINVTPFGILCLVYFTLCNSHQLCLWCHKWEDFFL